MASHMRRKKIISLSVVVVNYNGGERLLSCILSITLQSSKPQIIILVDNASTDHSADAVEKAYPEVNIVRLKENRGPSAARNAGIAQSKTDLVLFVDADIYLARFCLQRLVLAYRQYSAVICPRIVFYSNPEFIQCDGTSAHFIGTLTLLHNRLALEKAPRTVQTVGGCPSACLLVETRIARELGGFDESYFFYFEDLEFNLKLRSKGYRIMCESRAVALHDTGRGTTDLSYRIGQKYPQQRFYLTVRNRLMTIFTYYRLRTIISLLPVFILYELAGILVAAWRGWLTEWARAWRWQVQNRNELRMKRQEVQATRRLGDRNLLTGGPLPISEGLIGTPIAKLGLRLLSSITNLYWRFIKILIE